MRTYLTNFLIKQQYQASDANYLLSAYDKITQNVEASRKWESAISLYDTDCNCDYKEIIAKADAAASLTGVLEYTAELLIFLCLSKRLETRYIERGIDLEIFERSMADLRYKLEECKLVYGIIGSFVADWFVGFFDLTRFALGRLQFEVIDFGKNYEKDGKILCPESKVINIHIPRSGEPLTEDACMSAYLRAKDYFKSEVSTAPCPFVCHSWLLYPELENILPKHTNTYRFFKSFDVFSYKSDKKRNDLWRLFDTREQNVDKLPTDSSIRRAFVEHLKNDGKVGWGYGVLFV